MEEIWLLTRILASNQLSAVKKKLDAEQEVAFSSICDICVELTRTKKTAFWNWYETEKQRIASSNVCYRTSGAGKCKQHYLHEDRLDMLEVGRAL
jgi:hypothetical protein